MPETTTERLAALVGVLAALLLLLVAVTANSRGDPIPVAASGAPETAADVATPSATPAPASPVAASTKPKPRPKTPANQPLLILTAARGDCWLSAHSGSAEGTLLYEGTLLSGRSLRLNGPRLWLRFGAAANLDLTLNGKRIAALPTGTGDVVATARGIQPAV